MGTSSTNLGRYTNNEKPAALAVTLKDYDGDVMDITGYSVQVDWVVKGQSPADVANRFSGSVSDGPNGIVSVPWGTQSDSPFDDDTAAPPYSVEMEVWAGNTTIRTASEKFRFVVLAALNTTAPTV